MNNLINPVAIIEIEYRKVHLSPFNIADTISIKYQVHQKSSALVHQCSSTKMTFKILNAESSFRFFTKMNYRKCRKPDKEMNSSVDA